MIEEGNLKPPIDIQRGVEKEASRVVGMFSSKRLNIGDTKIARLEKELKQKTDSWRKQTGPLRRRLIRYNDMLEGVVEETNFPFDGASNITLHYAAGTMAAFKSSFDRIMYQDQDVFQAVNKGDQAVSNEDLDMAQDKFNESFHTDCNGLDELKQGTVPTGRDGTMVISGRWERRIEHCGDYRLYKNSNDFIKDYPDAETAGMEQEAYDNVLDKWVLDPEFEYNVGFDYDFVEYDGPVYEIISLARHVFFPTYAPTIKRLELYGSEYSVSEAELKTMQKRRQVWETKSDEVMAHSHGMTVDQWDNSRNRIEGLIPDTEGKKPIKLMDLVYKTDLDDDGVQEKYFLIFAQESGKLLHIEKYFIRRNIDNCVAFRFAEREGRYLGTSLLGDTEDLFMLMDTIHNHRNNIRVLCTAPIVLVQKNLKELVDFGRSENVVRPGTPYYVEDIDKSMKQLVFQNLDQPGNSLDEENLVMRFIELRFGPTQGLSGKETPSDPHAPMGKTLALLNQANLRIDDYANCFRKSLPLLAELHAALLFQYGQTIEMTVDKDGVAATKDIPKAIFANEKVKWVARRRSVTFSPEFSMQRIGGLEQFYLNIKPLLVAQDPIAIEMWNRMVVASGEPDNEKFLVKAGMPGAMGNVAGMPGMPGLPGQPGPGNVPPAQVPPQPNVIQVPKLSREMSPGRV